MQSRTEAAEEIREIFTQAQKWKPASQSACMKRKSEYIKLQSKIETIFTPPRQADEDLDTYNDGVNGALRLYLEVITATTAIEDRPLIRPRQATEQY